LPTGHIPRAWLAWSSGKDSLWALHLARESGEVAVVGLLVTITDPYRRVSMHGVRESLVEAQAAALGLPLHVVRIPSPCSHDEYEARMARAMEEARRSGVTHVVFGDVHLADVRAYREERLASVGMEAAFPLWGRASRALAEEIIAGGVRAVVTCLDPRKMPRELAGREFDGELLRQLPDEVDPCGENGEFHTFAWDGPGFAAPIAVEVGETVERDGFVFTDVLPAEQAGGE
jgi:uncharacterized protein (TIGR00290 family)